MKHSSILTLEHITTAAAVCTSGKEILEHLSVPYNSRYLKIVTNILKTNNIELQSSSKFPPTKKTCPACQEEFNVQGSDGYRKTTCSRSCSNKHFRSGRSDHYRNICFRHHQKKCAICDESRIVEVHHYDEDHSNNDPCNLIPLCPTHHKLYHSRYRPDVETGIDMYHETYRDGRS